MPPPPALREGPVKHICCPSPGRDRAWLPVPPLATLGEGLDTGSRVVEVAGGWVGGLSKDQEAESEHLWCEERCPPPRPHNGNLREAHGV